MIAKYVQKGCSVNYTPTTDINAGDVVIQGDLVGVAKLDIQADTLGALAVNGVFEVAKALTTEFEVGGLVYWSATDGEATTTATDNHYLGICIAEATDSEYVVKVLLNAPYVATVTEDANEG